MGASSQEYQDLAKKSHMDDLHLEILKLRDRVGAIQRSQDYAKVVIRKQTNVVADWELDERHGADLYVLWLLFSQEKSMLLQTAIESNNDKASWVSVIQVRAHHQLALGEIDLFDWRG